MARSIVSWTLDIFDYFISKLVLGRAAGAFGVRRLASAFQIERQNFIFFTDTQWERLSGDMVVDAEDPHPLFLAIDLKSRGKPLQLDTSFY